MPVHRRPFMTRSVLRGCDSGRVEPAGDLVDIEPQEPAPLVERDAPLADESANMAHRYPEVVRQVIDRDQPADIGGRPVVGLSCRVIRSP